MKYDHNERCRNIIHYAGDILGISTIPQARSWWKRVNAEAKEIENAKKKAQAEADIINRQIKRTPSRKHTGKHDGTANISA